MKLTLEEEAMLKGKYGPGKQKAMELTVSLGEAFGAEELVPVDSVHILAGGRSYDEAGIEWLEDLVNGGGVAHPDVYVTRNPGSADHELWREMGLEDDLVDLQKRLDEVVIRFGAVPVASCVPYLLGNLPRWRTRFCWAGSSGQVYANSVLGAWGNREGGIACIAAAITGKTPAYGLLIPENRYARVVVRPVDLDPDTLKEEDLAALGYYVGQQLIDKIPVFTGLPARMKIEQIRALAYSLPVGGGIPMFHIAGLTPEAPTVEHALGFKKPESILEVGPQEIARTKELFRRADDSHIDLVIFGCPHCTIQEIAAIASRLEGKRINPSTRLWVCTSKQIKVIAQRLGYVETITRVGGLVLADLCAGPACPMGVVTPKVKVIATNSIKTAFYAPGTSGVGIYYGTLDECLESAVAGEWRG